MNSELINIIIKEKVKISISVFFALIFSIFYSFYSTPLYNSYVTIYPSNNEREMGSISDFGNMINQFQNLSFGSANLGSTTYNINDLVNSNNLKESIINQTWSTNLYQDKVNLLEYWELNDNNFNSLIDRVKIRLSSVVTDNLDLIRIDKAKNILDTRIEVIEQESGLFIINVLMEEPQLASDIANYISSFIQDYISKKSTDKAKKNKNFINERLFEIENKLKISEQNLLEFFKKNPTVDTPVLQFENLTLSRELEINQEIYLTILKELEIAKIEELKELEIIQILDDASAPIEKAKPNILIIMIIFLNFSLLCSISYFFIKYNYLK